ncbi:Hint domain-containing protein [Nioella sp. MMSF_3534]|uniref:Hint domain-containing protein n=1 Tax=Nioella sp. MMSF_3534 TaxID=3046720 RepID=UPI00273EE554|nr:Hint domain-containing protein [Nioella sp. MMSF_3534]
MADFDFDSVQEYQVSNGNIIGSNYSQTETLFDDGTVDSEFTNGEQVLWGTNDFNDTFFGTTVHEGVTLAITFDGVHYYVLVPAGETISSWPANFSSFTVDQTAFTPCFLGGVEIDTPSGTVRVEELAIGDKIRSWKGSSVTVKWVGHKTVSTRFARAERLMPVRFAAGSLGDGLPQSDLTVTADHGMLVDGVICHAGALVNGTTIRRVPLAEMGDSYTVYHVETEAHEIILANGAPAETFIDNVSRRAFDNFAEFEALYGDVPEMDELPYPRAMSARQVPQGIFMRLSQREVA